MGVTFHFWPKSLFWPLLTIFWIFLQKNWKMVFVSTKYAPKVIFEPWEEYANAKYLNFIVQENVRKYVNLGRIVPDYWKTVIVSESEFFFFEMRVFFPKKWVVTWLCGGYFSFLTKIAILAIFENFWIFFKKIKNFVIFRFFNKMLLRFGQIL